MSTSSKPTIVNGVKTLMTKLHSESMIPSRRRTLPVLGRHHKPTVKEAVPKRRSSEWVTSRSPNNKKVPTSSPPESFEAPAIQKGVQSRKRYTMTAGTKIPTTTKRQISSEEKSQMKHLYRGKIKEDGVNGENMNNTNLPQTNIAPRLLVSDNDNRKLSKTSNDTGNSDTDSNSGAESDVDYDSDTEASTKTPFVSRVTGGGGGGRQEHTPRIQTLPTSTPTPTSAPTTPPPHAYNSLLALQQNDAELESSHAASESRRRSSARLVKKLQFPALECCQISPTTSTTSTSSPRKSIEQLEEEITDIEEIFSRVQEAVTRGNVRKRILVYSSHQAK